MSTAAQLVAEADRRLVARPGGRAAVLSYKGQTIQVYLVGAEDTTLQTSFVVDDFALNLQ